MFAVLEGLLCGQRRLAGGRQGGSVIIVQLGCLGLRGKYFWSGVAEGNA